MQMPPSITKLTQKQIKYIVFVFVLYSVECLSKKDLQVASFQFISAVYQLFWNPGCARSRTDTAHLSVSENVFSDFYPCETQFEDYTFRARTFFFFFFLTNWEHFGWSSPPQGARLQRAEPR